MIIKLPKSICNQIAAGEVVERPSSVVKELVENSIDAGAKNITVEISKAGKEFIAIRDDGMGIEESDLPLVFERNATSKIKSIEDVYNVMSLGFRGEALASISSVAKIILMSRHKDSSLGNKIIYYHDEIKERSELACAQGTSISVSDIFYNTPARYKFLKSNASEKASIMSVMTNMALSYPEIAFTVISDEKEEFRTNGRGDLEEVIKLLFERDFAKSLLPVSIEQNDIKIGGFVCNPQYSRGNRARQFIFVNGRIVQSKFLNRVIESAYDSMMMKRRYPAFVIKVDVPANMLDVNIHPQKLEVKFDREDIIESLLYNVIRNTLVNRRISREADLNRISAGVDIAKDLKEKEDDSPDIEYEIDMGYKEYINKTASEDLDEYDIPLSSRESSTVISSAPLVISSKAEQSYNIDKGAQNWADSYSTMSSSVSKLSSRAPHLSSRAKSRDLTESYISNSEISPLRSQKLTSVEMTDVDVISSVVERSQHIEEIYLQAMLDSKKSYDEEYAMDLNYADFKIIGQVLNTFIVCECGTSVYYIDQHAAHERVLFERYYKAFKEKNIENQMLLEAIEYKANIAELDSVEKAIDFLITLGVEVEKQDEKTWFIKSVPVFKEPIQADELIDIIDKYALDRGETYHKYFIDKIIMQACKSAIKSGDVLNHIQMQDLINMLNKCENPHSCPHGRPSTIEMKRTDFDKLFKRIV